MAAAIPVTTVYEARMVGIDCSEATTSTVNPDEENFAIGDNNQLLELTFGLRAKGINHFSNGDCLIEFGFARQQTQNARQWWQNHDQYQNDTQHL